MKVTIINVLAILLYLTTSGSGFAISGSEKLGIDAASVLENGGDDDGLNNNRLQSIMKRSGLNDGEDTIEGLLARSGKDVRRAIEEIGNMLGPRPEPNDGIDGKLQKLQ